MRIAVVGADDGIAQGETDKASANKSDGASMPRQAAHTESRNLALPR